MPESSASSMVAGQLLSKKTLCVLGMLALMCFLISNSSQAQTTGELLDEVVEYDRDAPVFHEHAESGRAPCVNCDAYQPRWLIHVGTLSMNRVTDESQPLIQKTANLSQQINAEDFDFDWQIGLDVSLMRKAWDDSALELRYLDLGELNANASLVSAAGQARFNAVLPVFAPNVGRIDSSYDSALYSLEANYHYPLYDRALVSAGLRYFSFDDDLRARLDAAPQTFLYEDATENDLYGGQLGLTAIPWQPFCGSPLWNSFLLSAFGKVGVYGNAGSHRSFIDTGVTRLAINESFNSVSFAGEFGATGRMQIGDGLAFIAGYNLLWLEHVAIASEQLAASDYFSGTGHQERGSALLHGVSLAIELQR
ncbi:MAG: hypothetical protein AB8B91_06105 [Rubripirellula sp.]